MLPCKRSPQRGWLTVYNPFIEAQMRVRDAHLNIQLPCTTWQCCAWSGGGARVYEGGGRRAEGGVGEAQRRGRGETKARAQAMWL